MANLLDSVDSASLRSDIPAFRPGDTVNVHVRVIEGNRSRVQQFKGVVIRRQGAGVRETFTVRKVSFSVGVERTFPVHTPIVEKIELVTRGDVRRAKLYYLRELRGKAAKIKEKREQLSSRTGPQREPDSIWPRWTPKHSTRSATAPPHPPIPGDAEREGEPRGRRTGRAPLLCRSSSWVPGGRITLTLLLCMVSLLLVSTFVMQPFQIPSGSMEPAFRVGDRVLVNKLAYRFGSEPQRGDAVVFDGSGYFGDADYIKRVVGVGGDRVVCCDERGRIKVNGEPVDEPYLYPGDAPSRCPSRRRPRGQPVPPR